MKHILIGVGLAIAGILAVEAYGLYIMSKAHDHYRDDEHYRTDW